MVHARLSSRLRKAGSGNGAGVRQLVDMVPALGWAQELVGWLLAGCSSRVLCKCEMLRI